MSKTVANQACSHTAWGSKMLPSVAISLQKARVVSSTRTNLHDL